MASSNATIQRRLRTTLAHVHPSLDMDSAVETIACSSLSYRPSELKLDAEGKRRIRKQNGWGFKDTEFRVRQKKGVYQNAEVFLSGDRYSLSGSAFPHFVKFAVDECGVDLNKVDPPRPIEKLRYPEPIVNQPFMDAVKAQKLYKNMTFDGESRLYHGHGHTCQEMFMLKYPQPTGDGFFVYQQRIPDVVIYPGEHAHVEAIVRLAHEHNVCIIPYGGGTTVSQALECDQNEKRMIVSLDMQEMNKLVWIDTVNRMACIEAGASGQMINEMLRPHGFTMGHEPDSYEFSTLGGWVATRASGMKKNIYGNIEDILINVKVVTPIGTYEKGCNVPRQSTGPDMLQVILGSEGTIGVVTSAVVRLRPLPKAQKYGSVAFPAFENGVRFMHEVAKRRVAPASIRLMDNEQFQFGHALKTEEHNSYFKDMMEWLKKQYITKVKGFNLRKLCAVTLLFEGDPEDIKRHEAIIYDIAAQFGGLKAGEESGVRGYFLTFMIAYLRDYAFDYGFLAESFETSVPWSNVLPLCERVKAKIIATSRRLGVVRAPFVSCRVTQAYDTGAAVYFYFGVLSHGLKDPVAAFTEIENTAREEILSLGGSLSHHHGIGKHRSQFMQQAVGNTGIEMIKAVKSVFDPKNIFGTKNLVK